MHVLNAYISFFLKCANCAQIELIFVFKGAWILQVKCLVIQSLFVGVIWNAFSHIIFVVSQYIFIFLP